MPRPGSGTFLWVMFIGILLLAASCSKDTIPTTPSPPFLFTDLRLLRSTSPTPGTTLSKGQNVTVYLNSAYTLDPSSDAQRANLAVLSDAFYLDATDTLRFLTLTQSPPLAATSGVIAETLKFTVPQAALSITVFSFVDTIPYVNPVISYDSQNWPVK
ncbi:MAG TPA: hypothetical protein VL126_14940 [Bacteroidota bacterium]|nr:hypothetical protein [Bacteroidota bacterium]